MATILCSHHKCIACPISTSRIKPSLTGVRRHLSEVLVCSSLVIHVDCFVLYQLAICMSSLVRCLFKSWPIFIWVICFLVPDFKYYLILVILNLNSHMWPVSNALDSPAPDCKLCMGRNHIFSSLVYPYHLTQSRVNAASLISISG
jgi:hypothetical protein